MSNQTKTVLILVNKQTTIVNFRLEVVAALVKEGYRVVVSVPEGDRLDEIRGVGAEILVTPMEKDSTDPIKDLKLLRRYRRMGGELITIGSDAHKAEHIGAGIAQAQDTLRRLGWQYFATFEQGKPIFHHL